MSDHQDDLPQPGVWLARLTIAGLIVYLLIDVLLHFLPPHYNPIRQPESDYAIGPFGFLMTLNFIIRGLLSLTLLWGLIETTEPASRSRPGMVLLGVWSVGAFLLALFPTDVEGSARTLTGGIHALVAFAAFISIGLAEFLIARHFAFDTRWQTLHRSAVTIAMVALGTLLLFFIAAFEWVASPGQGLGNIFGLLERLFLGLVLLWMFFVAHRIRSICYRHHSARS